MARHSASFAKRQKERKRQERQIEKAARRAEIKAMKKNNLSTGSRSDSGVEESDSPRPPVEV